MRLITIDDYWILYCFWLNVVLIFIYVYFCDLVVVILGAIFINIKFKYSMYKIREAQKSTAPKRRVKTQNLLIKLTLNTFDTLLF